MYFGPKNYQQIKLTKMIYGNKNQKTKMKAFGMVLKIAYRMQKNNT
jgi:hypothetical protein